MLILNIDKIKFRHQKHIIIYGSKLFKVLNVVFAILKNNLTRVISPSLEQVRISSPVKTVMCSMFPGNPEYPLSPVLPGESGNTPLVQVLQKPGPHLLSLHGTNRPVIHGVAVLRRVAVLLRENKFNGALFGGGHDVRHHHILIVDLHHLLNVLRHCGHFLLVGGALLGAYIDDPGLNPSLLPLPVPWVLVDVDRLLGSFALRFLHFVTSEIEIEMHH